jgi:hypothetical protein
MNNNLKNKVDRYKRMNTKNHLNRRYEKKVVIILRSKNYFNHFIYNLVLLC